MRSKTIAFLVGAALLSGPTLSSAQGHQDKSATITALRERQTDAVRQRASVATKLSAADQQALAQQAARVQKLIDRLEAGQAVSAQEIDAAFGLASR